MKAVIVYYSLEGNTELIANMLAEETGAELVKLDIVKKFKNTSSKYFFGGKSAIFKETPKLTKETFVLDNFDTIFIGTPVWAGTFSSPINTFLSKNKISGKKVVLFACHAGDNEQKCFKNLKKALVENDIIGTLNFINPKQRDKQEIKNKVHEFCSNIL